MNEHQARLLDGVSTLAVVDGQWGDTGKGKFIDLFAEWADVIVRGTGGANAGHTIKVDGATHIFHLLPSGIRYDGEGKVNVIGRGVAFDPKAMCDELDLAVQGGLTAANLKISHLAHLVLPHHLLLDRIRERALGRGKLGTTGRGIGPVYGDHVARVGLFVGDLLDIDRFVRKFRANLAHHAPVLKLIEKDDELRMGLDEERVIARYRAYAERLDPYIAVTEEIVRRALAERKRILLEGAQGVLLSLDYGTYPFVTSSDCSIVGLAKGCHLRESEIDRTLTIVKAFAMTRVGAGPFPTELGGEKSASWCNSSETTKDEETRLYPDASVNSADGFLQGIAIRRVGAEYGATTGRPRRVGWLDLPLLRYAMRFASPDLILTKLDMLDEVEVVRICDGYRYLGPPRRVGEHTLLPGDKLQGVLAADADILAGVQPVYAEFPGWQTPTVGMTAWEELPENLLRIIKFVEQQTGGSVRAASVGPDRTQTIFRV